MHWLIAWIALALPISAQADSAGDFDYYVLSLSWSPNWCAIEGDARGSDQCHPRHDHGWIMHGLWPQFEKGYPEHCQTTERGPSRRMTAEMSDIMGTAGLAWYQWKKHGTCSGLSAEEYYAQSRAAYARIERPAILRRVTEEMRIAPAVIEQAFLEANPGMSADQITITCKKGHIQEARICLTKDLRLRACSADVRRDCTMKNARFTPIR